MSMQSLQEEASLATTASVETVELETRNDIKKANASNVGDAQ